MNHPHISPSDCYHSGLWSSKCLIVAHYIRQFQLQYVQKNSAICVKKLSFVKYQASLQWLQVSPYSSDPGTISNYPTHMEIANLRHYGLGLR